MTNKILIAVVLVVSIFWIAGCKKQISNQANDVVDAVTGVGAVKMKLKADADIAKAKCVTLCRSKLIDLAEGIVAGSPCIGNPISGMPDWVCDVAHNPRQKIDDLPENQCSSFRTGRARHFIEVDSNCGFIRSY